MPENLINAPHSITELLGFSPPLICYSSIANNYCLKFEDEIVSDDTKSSAEPFAFKQYS